MYKKISAKAIYFIYSAVVALALQMAFNLIGMYRINTIGLNPLQLILVGTVLEGAVFLFEIPTGVVADIYSRRLSVLIGIFLIGIGVCIEGSFPLFAAVILSQIIWGLGYTFTSGADDAWIADEVGEEGLEGIYIRGSQLGQIFSFIGIIISVQMGRLGLNLPILVGGGMLILLGVFMAFSMPETGFRPAALEEKNTLGKMAHTFMSGLKKVKSSKVLIYILCISAVYGLASEGFDRLYEMHIIKDIGFPKLLNIDAVTWFGIINGVSMLLSIAAGEIVKRSITEKGKEAAIWILYVVNIVMVISVIVFGLSGNFALAVSALWANRIMNRINDPIYRAWTNKHVNSQVRATVFSMSGQVNALGQIIGGPVIGIIASKVSVPFGIIITGVFLAPVIPLLAAMFRRDKSEEYTEG